MTEVVPTDQQVQQITASSGQPIALRSSDGTFLGFVDCTFTPEELVAASASLKPIVAGYTTTQVLQHLATLERIEAKSELTKDQLLDLSNQVKQLASDQQTLTAESVTSLAVEFGISEEDVRELVMQPFRED